MTLAFINMLETLKTMVTANQARFTVIPAFADAFAEITSRLTTMQALKLIAVEKTIPQTEANKALKLELCQKTVSVAGTISSLASKLGDVALKAEMNVKLYKLEKMAAGVLTAHCQNIHTKATTHKVAAADYKLTQAMLDELQALITEYTTEVPEVRTEGGEINTAKGLIEKHKGECREVLEGQLDPMVNILLETDPGAVDLWRSARVVVDPPSTPTQLKVKVFTLEGETFVPLADIPFVAVNGKEYTLVTDELGEAQKKPIPYGEYELKCNMPGFKPFLQKKFKMVRGKVNKVEVVLERLPE